MNKVLNIIVWAAMGGVLNDAGVTSASLHFWAAFGILFAAQLITLFWRKLA